MIPLRYKVLSVMFYKNDGGKEPSLGSGYLNYQLKIKSALELI